MRRVVPKTSVLLAVLTASSFAQLVGTPANAADAWPSGVKAVYKVSFNGFDVGSFRFNTQVNGTTYNSDAYGEFSAFFGAFKWKGGTKASGTVGGAPKPGDYSFNYKSNKKAGSVQMSFKGGTVINISVAPPAKPNPLIVPVQPDHLKGVIDPMTAVMSLSHAGEGNPCNKKLQIFDGKVRFDVIFTPHGQQKISEQNPSGQPATGYVCRVKYVPISGYKKKEDPASNAATEGTIEMVLRPIPSANLLVPHQVTIPMFGGAAVLYAERIDISMPGKGEIALTR